MREIGFSPTSWLTTVAFCLSLNLYAAEDHYSRVPTYDLRGEDPEKLQTITAANSQDGLAMLYLGTDGNTFQVLIDASNEAMAEGIPVAGIFVGTPASKLKYDMEFFADIHWVGKMTTTELDTLQERVLAILRANYQKFIVSGFVSEGSLSGEPQEVADIRNIALQVEANKERLRVLDHQQQALQEHLDTLEGQN